MSTTENIESFSALIDQTIAAFPAAGAGSRDWTAQLLSPERAQRFELVMHLIANLAQPLVVCGPDGVGKTTFLGLLAERAFEGWRVVNLSANGPWTHGDIIARIAERLALPNTTEKAVADYLQQQPPNKSVLVLSLDEAGKLAPGVIDSLWQFARTYPALRVVLALSPDEIHLKNTSDSVALGDSRFVDIPPLTEAACEAFLRRLSVRPPRLLLPEEVTTSRARSLYQASHGVPGRIIQLLNKKTPTRSAGGSNTSMRLAYSLAATALVFAVVLVYAWRHGTTPPPVAQLKPPQAVPPQPLALHTPPAAPTPSAEPPAPARETIPQQPAPDKPAAPAESVKVAEAPLPAITPPPPAAPLQATEQPVAVHEAAKATAAPISTATPPQPAPLPAIPTQPVAQTAKVMEAPTVSQPPATVPVAPEKPVAPIETVKAVETPAAASLAAPPFAPVVPAAPVAPASMAPPPVVAVTPPAIPPPPTAVAAPKATPHAETATADHKPAPAKKAALAIAPGGPETGKPAQPPLKKAEIKPPALPAPLPAPTPLKPQAPAPRLPPPAPIALVTPKPAPPAPPPAIQTRVPPLVADSEARPAAPQPAPAKPAHDVAEDVWSDDDAPVKEIASYKSKLWAFRDDAPAPSANRATAAPSAAAAVNPAATYGRPQKSPSADALPAPVVVDPGNYVAGEAAETAPVVAAVPYTAPISPPRPVAPPPPQPMAAAAPAAKTPALPATSAGLPGADWLLTQPSQAYTLRIMSARDPASVRALLERYPAMRGRLATLKSHNGAMEMYTVYYGTFATQAEANQAAAALPAFLGKPVPRQLNLIQQEARSPQRGGTGR